MRRMRPDYHLKERKGGGPMSPNRSRDGRRLSAAVACAALMGGFATSSTARASAPHVVVPGETLWSISAANNLTTRTVAAFNGIAENAQVVEGQTIQVPTVDEGAVALAGVAPVATGAAAAVATGGSHTVVAGESLSSVAAVAVGAGTEIAVPSMRSAPDANPLAAARSAIETPRAAATDDSDSPHTTVCDPLVTTGAATGSDAEGAATGVTPAFASAIAPSSTVGT